MKNVDGKGENNYGKVCNGIGRGNNQQQVYPFQRERGKGGSADMVSVKTKEDVPKGKIFYKKRLTVQLLYSI